MIVCVGGGLGPVGLGVRRNGVGLQVAVITIAHRLSTIRRADRVVVLHEGRILEEGSFDTLSKRGGYFSALLNAQALGPQGELVT